MTSSRSKEWDRVRQIEDLLALLSAIDDRRRIIRTHAWREGSWDAVYQESTAMRHELAQLKTELSAAWSTLHAAATEATND